MNDSVGKTVVKSIGATAGACALGFIFEMLLALLCFWLMDLGLFWCSVLGIILLPIVLVPWIGTMFLSSLFKNRVAEIIFQVVVALWLLFAVINMSMFIFNNNPSDGERFIAVVFMLVVVFDILALMFCAFVNRKNLSEDSYNV